MSASTCRQVLEIRQYTLRPGMRDVLVGLFEQEFIEKMDLIKCAELCRIPSRGSHDGGYDQPNLGAGFSLTSDLMLRPAAWGHGEADPTRAQ